MPPVLPAHQRIAAAMCAATEDLLWPQRNRWLERKLPDSALRIRTGCGRATYCQQQRHQFTITFGVRMVSEKCVPDLAAQWLTTREIHRYGYWGGLPAVGELLAHTVCHEFAHLIQQANRWWRRGSVHNARFYEVLGKLYSEGAAHQVLVRLRESAASTGVDLNATVPPQSLQPASELRDRFAPGDRVAFPGRGQRNWVGRIQRVNRCTATVIPEDRRFQVTYFRVPFHLLQPIRAASDD